MSDFNKCDVCGIENENVLPGRWIFYCPEHKQKDWEKTYENEVKYDLESGNLSDDGELQELMLNNL